MTHVYGHIEKPPSSAGILRLTANKKTYHLNFLPPPFPIAKDMEIGFHPIKISNTQVIATDVVLWSNHASADAVVAGLLGKPVEMLHRPTDVARLRNCMAQSYFTEDQLDVVRRTINYFQIPDFKFFYFKAGAPDPDMDYVISQITSMTKAQP